MESVNYDDLIAAEEKIQVVSQKGNKLIIAGNCGSASMGPVMFRLILPRLQEWAINFNEADLLTCFANDYCYEKVFSKPAPGNIFKLGISEMVLTDAIPITKNYKNCKCSCSNTIPTWLRAFH